MRLLDQPDDLDLTQLMRMISDNHKSTSTGLTGLVVQVCNGLERPTMP